ncbi:MAG: SDR family oxidoreductase [Gammaproteobacteria bacterium]|nr:SDR family oxidoreductase [Gammaproteobacteria bacterium]
MKEREHTALITGASRGIGKAICDKLLQQGCHVIGVARAMDAIPKASGLTPVSRDLADLNTLPEWCNEIIKANPEIDTLVLNAGRGHFGSLEEFSPIQIQQLIDLNLTSQILLARAFLPHFKRNKRGQIIFMGSEAALSGGRKGSIYAATKFALRGVAQSLRDECAATGIRVGIINPGMVESSFFEKLDFRPGEAEDQHLLPEDVAEACWTMIAARLGAAIDEINLSPQKRVIRFD